MNQHMRFGFLSHTRSAKAEIWVLISHASRESSDEPENQHFLFVFFFFFLEGGIFFVFGATLLTLY